MLFEYIYIYIYILYIRWSRKYTKNKIFSSCKEMLQLRQTLFSKAVTTYLTVTK